MARFRLAPCQGYLKHSKCIYCFLCDYKNTAIKFNTEILDCSNYKVEKKNRGHIYHRCQEEIPVDMPEPSGKPVMATTFVDANLLHDVITGRSYTGIIQLLNKTPIDWFSKRQNTVKTATYRSEFVATRTAVDQIVDLRYTMRILGVPLTGPSWMFGDNLVREAQTAGFINFVHIDGKHNPAD
eukprot:6720899-Ditylum_brightwellii.AAC.1